MARTAFWATIWFATYVWSACQQTGPPQNERVTSDGYDAAQEQDSLPFQSESVIYFTRAEQQLAVREYHLAAVHLHDGIIAFRTETGRIHGKDAARINRAIWTLTRLRSRLHNGEQIGVPELHGAVHTALRLHPKYHRTLPPPVFKQMEPDPIFIPVKE